MGVVDQDAMGWAAHMAMADTLNRAAAVLVLALVTATSPAAVAQTLIVDGDTLSIGKITYRLWGINAPEIGEPGGLSAKYALRNLIGYDDVRCRSKGEPSHGRTVAICSTNRYFDLGAMLVMMGSALDCTKISGGRYRALEPEGVRSRLKDKPYCKPD